MKKCNDATADLTDLLVQVLLKLHVKHTKIIMPVYKGPNVNRILQKRKKKNMNVPYIL